MTHDEDLEKAANQHTQDIHDRWIEFTRTSSFLDEICRAYKSGARWERERWVSEAMKRLGDGLCSCERCDEIRWLLQKNGVE